MMAALVLLAALSLTALMSVGQPASVVYQFTARDFMPCACMRPGEIDLYWKNTNKGASNPRRITDRTFCPINQDILDGKYTGHPDYEPHPDLFANGCVGDAVTMASDKTMNNYTLYRGGQACALPHPEYPSVSRIVMNYMQYDPSGIPKPVYCSRGSGPFNTYGGVDMRCGWEVGNIPSANARVSTTGEDMFNLWFRDDPRYSKRVGSTRVLQPVPNAPDVFLYDSASIGFHPLDDHLACVGVNGRLNCSNGGKVFPKSLLEGNTHWDPDAAFTNETALNKSFSFTVELHTFFQFRGTETFNFSGDDDVWVFLNEQLAVDVGGLHPPQPGVINLTNPYVQQSLGLVKDGTYALDIFMAERHSDAANFRVTTSLSPGCNIANSGKVAYSWLPSNSTQDWKLVGGSTWGVVEGSALKLIDRKVRNVVSYAFLQQQINVGTGFVLTFSFQTSTGGVGEGFTLTIQRDRITDLNGGSGGNLGFANMYNALGIAFDLCLDRDTNPTGCALKQVRLHHVNQTTERSSARNYTAKLYQSLFHPNLWDDGRVHNVQINYYSKTPPWLDVFVDNDLFLQKRGIDLEQIIGGTNAFVGFTASSGVTSSLDIKILDFQVLSVGLEDANTVFVPNAQNVSIARANGRDNVNFTLQTRDFCLGHIGFGGYANRAKALLYLDGNATVDPLPANVVDELNGRYRFEFVTTIPGNYSFKAWFGQACANNVSSPGCFKVSQSSVATFVPYSPPTSAPTGDATDSLPTRFYMGAGISAGLLAVLGGIALIFFVRARDQWRREEPFIKAGKLAAMERDVQYEGDAQIDALQHKLQDVLTKIQRERARGGGRRDLTRTIEELLTEKGELQELVRRLRLQKRGRDPDAAVSAGGGFTARIRAVANQARDSMSIRNPSQRSVSRRLSSLSNRASHVFDSFNPVFAGLSSAFRSKAPSRNEDEIPPEPTSPPPGFGSMNKPPPKPQGILTPPAGFGAITSLSPAPPAGFGIIPNASPAVPSRGDVKPPAKNVVAAYEGYKYQGRPPSVPDF